MGERRIKRVEKEGEYESMRKGERERVGREMEKENGESSERGTERVGVRE